MGEFVRPHKQTSTNPDESTGYSCVKKLLQGRHWIALDLEDCTASYAG